MKISVMFISRNGCIPVKSCCSNKSIILDKKKKIILGTLCLALLLNLNCSHFVVRHSVVELCLSSKVEQNE